VCDSCSELFRPRASQAVPLSLVGSQQFDSGDGSSVTPSQSASNAPPTKRERELQSDRDRLANQLRQRPRGSGSGSGDYGGKLKPQRSTVSRTVYGGRSGSLGGGDDRGREVCDLFNGDAGCYRGSCAYKHCCNVRGCRKPFQHSAPNH
jgi:hypothetical protein